MITPIKPKDVAMRLLRSLRVRIKNRLRDAVGAQADGLQDALELVEKDIKYWEKIP